MDSNLPTRKSQANLVQQSNYIFIPSLPMTSREDALTMQVSVEVTDEMRREAEARGLPIIDYIDFLIAKGRRAAVEDKAVSSAMERIRALRPK
ncbi:MAG: hypothetical protein ACLP00_26470 [Terracidiphilus sp.]